MMGRYLLVPVGTQVVVLCRRTRWEIFLHRYLPLIFLSGLVACISVLVVNLISASIGAPQVLVSQTIQESSIPKKPLGFTAETIDGPDLTLVSYKKDSISPNTKNSESFWLPSDPDPYLDREMVKRLNWSWPLLVQAAKEANVPLWSLVFIHYQEPIPHFALTNPANGEGIFQLHDLRKKGYYFTPYSKMKRRLTEDEFLTQARLAAEFLQNKAGNRLRFDMDPFNPVVIEALYSYNGRTYGKINLPSQSLRQELQKLKIPIREYVRSPYIVGRITASEHVMYLRTKGRVALEFYGYIPLTLRIRRLYKQ